MGDPNRFHPAAVTPVGNAAKHRPARPCLGPTCRVADSDLVGAVVTARPGVPPEDLPPIVGRFSRVGRRRKRTKGGLDLPIARAHGCRIGRGAASAIRLPPRAPAAEPEAAAIATATLPLRKEP